MSVCVVCVCVSVLYRCEGAFVHVCVCVYVSLCPCMLLGTVSYHIYTFEAIDQYCTNPHYV